MVEKDMSGEAAQAKTGKQGRAGYTMTLAMKDKQSTKRDPKSDYLGILQDWIINARHSGLVVFVSNDTYATVTIPDVYYCDKCGVFTFAVKCGH
jgi:hypothetical protein